jgi:hypothetical protein
MSFLDSLRDQIIHLATLGLPPKYFWAFPAREIGGRVWREVHVFTQAGEIVFEQLA